MQSSRTSLKHSNQEDIVVSEMITSAGASVGNALDVCLYRQLFSAVQARLQSP